MGLFNSPMETNMQGSGGVVKRVAQGRTHTHLGLSIQADGKMTRGMDKGTSDSRMETF